MHENRLQTLAQTTIAHKTLTHNLTTPSIEHDPQKTRNYTIKIQMYINSNFFSNKINLKHTRSQQLRTAECSYVYVGERDSRFNDRPPLSVSLAHMCCVSFQRSTHRVTALLHHRRATRIAAQLHFFTFIFIIQISIINIHASIMYIAW